MTPKQILRAARDKIADPAKWGKGRRFYDRPLETCCAAEAIEEVCPRGAERTEAARTLYNAVGLDWKCPNGLSGWNDAAERTHDEVIKAFNLAIAITY